MANYKWILTINEYNEYDFTAETKQLFDNGQDSIMMMRYRLFRSILMVIGGITFCAVLFNQPILLLALDQTDNDESVVGTNSSDKLVVHLYFSDKEGSFLTAEERVFFHSDRPADFAKIIIEALIEGPRKGLVRTIPARTILRALYVTQEGIAFVDFSDTIKDDHPGGVRSELLAIFSIVNSLILNMSQVDAVKILINGNESTTLAGHVDLRFPFKANMLLVR
ncbi:MAG: GerMN domain-containing protein [Deltaproteobacteria bacterium]|nr:GerMN domain-containing protein [Deltaproteobacteria bacterium]